jgi:hypothetical protein
MKSVRMHRGVAVVLWMRVVRSEKRRRAAKFQPWLLLVRCRAGGRGRDQGRVWDLKILGFRRPKEYGKEEGRTGEAQGNQVGLEGKGLSL